MEEDMPEWHERYRIGVESIDAAHQEIFSIINRLRKTLRMSGNVQWTAAETVKYLRSYTIKHFMDMIIRIYQEKNCWRNCLLWMICVSLR